MKTVQWQVQRQTGALHPVPGFRTGVSLHSHTNHSKENLDFLPHYIDFHQVPVVSQLVRSKLKKYEQRTGRVIDFRQAYWTPPMPSSFVFATEKKQIEEGLGLAAFVSITDHDSIAAPLELREKHGVENMPISVEWSIPFEGNVFHLGVHQIPPVHARELMQKMIETTAQPTAAAVSELLSVLSSFPEVLIVMNHPFCNFVRVPAGQHRSTLQNFLTRYREWMHAVEVNGMRPWSENQMVPGLAEEYNLPVVAGGDRHGSHPNAMLNLTEAPTLSEFVADVRKRQRNYALVLPAYQEPICMRELATAADVVRRYPKNPPGQRRFTDRIFANVEGFSWHPLSFYWDGSDRDPRWLYFVVGALVALGSKAGRTCLRRALFMGGEYERAQSAVREYGTDAGAENMGYYPR